MKFSKSPKVSMVPDDVDIQIADVAGDRLAVVSWPSERRRDSSLTPSERAIVRCIATGMSNSAIAELRGTSLRTVANQVASLLKKFGVASRYELCALMARPSEPGS